MIKLHRNIGRSLSLTHRHMVAYMAKRMEPLHIGAGQYTFLFSLYNEDGQSQQSLTHRLLVDKAATVRAINKLEDAGYVKRCPDPKDKRAHRIYLTEAGKAVRPQLEAIVAQVQATLLGDLTEEEARQFQGLLDKVAAAIVRGAREE